jgi:predicted nucleotidyltransferase
MNRTQTIAKLKSYADPIIKALGATSLFLFGSTARNESRSHSDLDLFVDYDPTGKFNALDLVDIKLLLEDHLGMEVDVTTRDSLHPMLRDNIEKTAIRVF